MSYEKSKAKEITVRNIVCYEDDEPRGSVQDPYSRSYFGWIMFTIGNHAYLVWTENRCAESLARINKMRELSQENPNSSVLWKKLKVYNTCQLGCVDSVFNEFIKKIWGNKEMVVESVPREINPDSWFRF